jgi:hypothetical protein
MEKERVKGKAVARQTQKLKLGTELLTNFPKSAFSFLKID